MKLQGDKEITLACEFTEMIDVNSLSPHPKNRNHHGNEQIERLGKLIRFHGFRHPIIVSKLSGHVVAGHGRLEAAKHIGLSKVPVDYQDFQNEEAEYAFLVSDNAIASWAVLDLGGINSDIGDLGPDFDIDLLGIKDFVLEPAEKFAAQCDEDEIPEHVEPKSKLGDVYQLGRHRLMCGDSTSIDAVEKLMGGEKADMVFTDPPYGIDYKDCSTVKGITNLKGNKYKPIEGDNEPFDPNLILGLFDYCPEMFMWGGDYYIGPEQIRNGSLLVWDKRIGEQDSLPGSHFEICWSKNRHARMLLRYPWVGVMATERGEKRVHPTQKSIKMIEFMLDKWGNKNDQVVDLFGGSGSTLIACEKTNRKCFMLEIDPHYCDVIVARWEKYTGKTSELLNG